MCLAGLFHIGGKSSRGIWKAADGHRKAPIPLIVHLCFQALHRSINDKKKYFGIKLGVLQITDFQPFFNVLSKFPESVVAENSC